MSKGMIWWVAVENNRCSRCCCALPPHYQYSLLLRELITRFLVNRQPRDYCTLRLKGWTALLMGMNETARRRGEEEVVLAKCRVGCTLIQTRLHVNRLPAVPNNNPLSFLTKSNKSPISLSSFLSNTDKTTFFTVKIVRYR